MTNAQQTTSRDQAIEALRILAAFAIVAFHAQLGDYRWWHSGLVVFVFLAAMFAAQPSERPRPVVPILKRLLVPFVFWYGVYLAANFVLGRPLLVESNWVTAVLAGPSFHLWFLPFAALLLVVLAQLPRLPELFQRGAVIGSGACGLIALYLSAYWFPALWPLPIPLTQWGHAAPAALIGLLIGYYRGDAKMALVALLLCVATALMGRQFGVSSITLAYYAGFLAIAVSLLLSRFWPAKLRVQPVADCMFGVYLTHIITLAIAARLVERGSIAQVLIAFGLSLAGVYLARRFLPVSRHVLG